MSNPRGACATRVSKRLKPRNPPEPPSIVPLHSPNNRIEKKSQYWSFFCVLLLLLSVVIFKKIRGFTFFIPTCCRYFRELAVASFAEFYEHRDFVI